VNVDDLLALAPQDSPRTVRPTEPVTGTDGVVQAVPLANGGPCDGDKCRRSSKGRRRAIWTLLDRHLCDRCAIRLARELAGGPALAVPRQRRNR